MALNGLFCADVPLSNYSLTHPTTDNRQGAAERAGWRYRVSTAGVMLGALSIQATTACRYSCDWQNLAYSNAFLYSPNFSLNLMQSFSLARFATPGGAFESLILQSGQIMIFVSLRV